jgi:hypothetical protein
MTNVLLWGACLTGWVVDLFLVAGQINTGGLL